ncbi:unnamed protein product [Caenorhabditis nigoni]
MWHSGVVLLWRVHDATRKELKLVLQAIDWVSAPSQVFYRKEIWSSSGCYENWQQSKIREPLRKTKLRGPEQDCKWKSGDRI